MTFLFKHTKIRATLLLLSLAFSLQAQLQDSTFTPLITTPATVSSLIADSDGSILVGGNFQFVNGETCQRVVRLLPDGTKDPDFNPSFSDTIVTSIRLQSDGKLLVCGFLPETDDQDEMGVVLRLLEDGSLDPAFSPALFNDRVLIIEPLDEQTILVGGLFSEYAGIGGSGLVILNNDGSLRQMLQLESADAQNSTDIYQIKATPDRSGFYATGNRGFEAVIHRFSRNGVLDTTFSVKTVMENGDFFTSIQDFVLDQNGNPWFTSFTWQFDPQLVAVDQSGNILDQWSVPNPQDLALLNDTTPLVATVLEGNPDAYKVENDQLVPFAEGPAADEFIFHMLPMPDGSFVAAGRFSFYKGFPFESIMRFTPDGQPDLTFFTRLQRSGIIRRVRTLEDGRIVIGGLFTQINQKEAIHLARLLPNGALDPSFALNVIPREHPVNDLIILDDGSIMVATDGRRLNEAPYFPIQRLTPEGQPDTTFATGLEAVTLGDVRGIILSPMPDTTFLGFGTYSFTSGEDRYSRIARFSYNGELDTTFTDLITANKINDIFAYDNGLLLLGGENIRIAGAAAQAVVRIRPRGDLDSSFLPEVSSNSEVHEIFQLESTKIMLSGQLFGLGEYSSLLRIFPDGRIDRTFDWVPDNPNREPTIWPRTVIPMGRDSFLISNRPGEADALFLQMDRRGELSNAYRTDYPFYTGDIHLANDTTLLVGGNFINPAGGSGLMRFFLNQDPPMIITGSREATRALPLQPYPNPTRDGWFYLQTPSHWTTTATLSVLRSNGQVVLQTTVSPGLHAIQLPQKETGLYLLRLHNDTETAQGVLVVQPLN